MPVPSSSVIGNTPAASEYWMAITLYELAGAGGRLFSPYCWRSRMALAHKGLACERVPVRFTDKHLIAFSGQTRVPVLVDEGTTVSDSWAIACHLDAAHGDRPSLFGGEAARTLSRFVNAWADRILHPSIIPMVVADVLRIIDPADRGYFRASREERFGMPLEEVQKDRDQRLPGFRAGLEPLRVILDTQPFLSGERPAYADYIVFGGFQWARKVSDFDLLETGDPVHAWRARMLGLFDGMAGKGHPC